MSAQRSQQMQESKNLAIYNHIKLSENNDRQIDQISQLDIEEFQKSNQKLGENKINQLKQAHDTHQAQRLRNSAHNSSSSSREGNESSTNNIEKQEGDEDIISDEMSSQSGSTPHQKIIDDSSSQLEKIDSIQSAFSRQISEQQSQQYKMPSDFEECSQATPISQAVSSSQINKVMMIDDDGEDDKINKNIFQDYSDQNFLSQLKTNMFSGRNDQDSNYFNESEEEEAEERGIQNQFYQEQQQKQSERINRGQQQLHEQNYFKNQDSESEEEQEESEDLDENAIEGGITEYSDEEDSIGDQNNAFQKKFKQERFQQEEEELQEQLNSAIQISKINKDINPLDKQKQLPPYQDRLDYQGTFQNANNHHQITNEYENDDNSATNIQNQIEYGFPANPNISNINDSQITNGQTNKLNDSSQASLSFLQESDKRQKKIDLLLRMQQFNGELKNDFEQAQNELLKLKTQKSLQLQDSSDSHSLRDIQERQNRYEDFSNLKQNINKYFETSTSIQTPAFIIENNSESKQSNSNGGISTQSNASFAQLKSSEIGSVYNEQNFVKQEAKICQTLPSSQTDFTDAKMQYQQTENSIKQIEEQNKDIQQQLQSSQKRSQQLLQELSLYPNQVNDIPKKNSVQTQQQQQFQDQGSNDINVQQQNTKNLVNKNEGKGKQNIQEHMDQLFLLEQEKLKIQHLILQKQKRLMHNPELNQQDINLSKNSIHTLPPPSKDISYFSTNSEQTQQNSIPPMTTQKVNNDNSILSQQKVQSKNTSYTSQQQQFQQGYQNQQMMQQQFQQQQIQQQLQQLVHQQVQDNKIQNQQQQQPEVQKKKTTSSSKNPSKKTQKQKSAKKPTQQSDQQNIKSEITSNQASASKKLLSRNVSNPKIQPPQIKGESIPTEGVEMKKQLEEKFQMQLEEIHYKNHLKVQKLMEKIKKLEEDNSLLKQELQKRSLAAKELKESEARIANLAQSIQDIQIGKLIQQELEVKSLQEAYLKLKNFLKISKQEKKFITCIVDMVSSCNPQQQPPKNCKSQQSSSNNPLQGKQDQQQSEEQSNLKQAWKWLKFIIEDYVNLKSKTMFQNNNPQYGPKLDKNSQMYKSCVVENQTQNKQNQMDQVSMQPSQLPLTSDTIVLQEINTYLKAENKYESLKTIKDIIAQNELLKQQITFYQKKIGDSNISSSVSSSSNISQGPGAQKRMHTLGSASMAYNIPRDSALQSPISSQPLYVQHQQQQRLLSPTSQQKLNSQQTLKTNTSFSSPQMPKNSVQQKPSILQTNINNSGNLMNNNNTTNSSNETNNKQQLLRKLSPKNSNNTAMQSENDYNSLNFTSNNNNISSPNNSNINQLYQKQNSQINSRQSANQTGSTTNHTSPQRVHTQGNMKSSQQQNDRLNTLHQSPRENNRNYNNNSNTNTLMSSPSSSYTRAKTSQCYPTNPYLQVMEKQTTKQF